METPNDYPTFYRSGNRCIKRNSDLNVMVVKIPPEGCTLPLSHDSITFPDKERLDEEVAAMDIVDKEVYESYLATFFQTAEKNRVKFNEVRQKRYVDAKGLR